MGESGNQTHWNRFAHIEVNVLIWRVLLGMIPTRVNLQIRGIDIPFFLFPVCDKEAEDGNHLFLTCEIVKVKVFKWINHPFPLIHTIHDLFYWVDNVSVESGMSKMLEVIIMTTMWVLWTY